MTNEYYYVACDGGGAVNEKYRHYFRLYKIVNEKPLLVEQGLADKTLIWEKQYSATLQNTNPYPTLD